MNHLKRFALPTLILALAAVSILNGQVIDSRYNGCSLVRAASLYAADADGYLYPSPRLRGGYTFSTGTVECANGTAEFWLEGDDPAWPIQVQPGYIVALGQDTTPDDELTDWYTITAVAGDGTLSLGRPYTGSTGTGKSFVVAEPARTCYIAVWPDAAETVNVKFIDGGFIPTAGEGAAIATTDLPLVAPTRSTGVMLWTGSGKSVDCVVEFYGDKFQAP